MLLKLISVNKINSIRYGKRTLADKGWRPFAKTKRRGTGGISRAAWSS